MKNTIISGWFRIVHWERSSGLLRVADVDELQLFDGGKQICTNHVAVGIADEKLLENRAYGSDLTYIIFIKERKEERHMYVKLMIPGYRVKRLWAGLGKLLLQEKNEVRYFGGAEVLPPPLEGEEENACIQMLAGEEPESARKKLIEHNLRLVVYISQKNLIIRGCGVEDLIWIRMIRELDKGDQYV